ncbi:MAG: dTMP kinase [Promethearchaeota archaeon]
MNKKNGVFIVLEGIDGCGSTTHANLLKDYLIQKNYKVHVTLEPSNLDVGKLLRKYLQKKVTPPPTDALLFAADRVEHYYNEILPKLNQNYIVISDRYLESSVAYQISQSITDSPFLITEEWVLNINKFAPAPDMTIILDIDPELALKRKYSVDEGSDKFENIGFLKKVRDIYLKRARVNNYIVIDASRKLEDVSAEIKDNVEKFISSK